MTSDAATLEGFYRAFEDAFRGPQALICSRLEVYLEFLKPFKSFEKCKSVVDLGCGRGEFLRLLLEQGFEPHGVDADEGMLAACKEAGASVSKKGAVEFLQTLQPESQIAISAIHLAEHLPFTELLQIVREAKRVLVPGGLLILETPNPENLKVSSLSFHFDPTHRHPLPNELLVFLAKFVGFNRTTVLRLHESSGLTSSYSTLNNVLNGVSPDYAIVAQKDADPQLLRLFDSAFARHRGISDQSVVAQFDESQAIQRQKVEALGELTTSLRTSLEAGQVAQSALRRQLEDDRAASHELVSSLKQALDIEASNRSSLEEEVSSLRRSLAVVNATLTAEKDVRRELQRQFLSMSAFGLLCRRFLAKGRIIERRLRPIFRRFRRKGSYKDLPAQGGTSNSISDISLNQSSILGAQEGIVALESAETQLAYKRLSALAGTSAITNLGSDLPRLAYVSPLPPTASGIAKYSEDLIAALAAHYVIDGFVAQDVSAVGAIAGCRIVRPLSDLRSCASEYDRILYHIGNSPFHQDMLAYVEQFPGVVVLHDLYLGHLLAHVTRQAWQRSLYQSHGYKAASCLNRSEDLETALWSYPSSYGVMQQASGVLVHSTFALDTAKLHFPTADYSRWSVVPFARSRGHGDRASARSSLGIPDEQWVVCSFGFLSPTKLCHRIIEAWRSSSRLNHKRCRLVFVGDLPAGTYRDDILEMVAGCRELDIQITGYVSEVEYNKYLLAADACVQLRDRSRGESSAAALDCVRMGLPTILNAHGSFAELPDDAVLKIPEYFEAGHLQRAMERLFNEPEFCEHLGARARHYGEVYLAPEVAAEAYRRALENYSQSAPSIANFNKLKSQGVSDSSGAELLARARELADRSDLRSPQRQLLFDVSAIVRHDLKTGIQRVVREQLLAILAMEKQSFRLEPVWLDNRGGEWRLRYARQFVSELIGFPHSIMPDQLVSLSAGDVYFGADFFTEGTIEAHNQGLFRKLRERGVSIAFSVYDLLPVEFPEFFPPGASETHRRWLNAITSDADRLICISQSVAEDFAEWASANLVQTPSVHFNHLGSDFASHRDSGDDPQNLPAAIKQAVEDFPTVLMVGTIEPRKGYLQAISAFEALWSQGVAINLLIVGQEGWKGLSDNDRRTIPRIVSTLREHRQLNKRLFWSEGVDDHQLAYLYRKANCLLAASEGEGFGLPLIEAARKGLPILARDIPVFREVLGDAAFFFEAASSLELADAIKRWLSSDSKRASSTSSSTHSAFVTWRRSAENLINFLGLNVISSLDDGARRRNERMNADFHGSRAGASA